MRRVRSTDAVVMVRMTAPHDQLIELEDVHSMPNGPEEDRDFQVWEIDRLLYEMEDIIIDGQSTKRRTARSKDFLENIFSYNHYLAFTSEGTSNVDHRVGHTAIGMQGSVYYLLGPLMPDDDMMPKRAQIHTLDGTPDLVNTRQHYFDSGNRYTLHTAQRYLRIKNPYLQEFNNYYDHFKEDRERYPIKIINIRIQ